MKIAILYQYFQGLSSPGHTLVLDLAQYLQKKGHEVVVIAGPTGYMEQNPSLLPWWRRWYHQEWVEGVPVVRTFSYLELHRGYWGRLLSFLTFSISSFLALLFISRPDVILASSPPLFPVFSAWMAAKLRRLPFIFEVRDLWPDSAIELKIVQNRILLGTMRFMEETMYRSADQIVTLTGGIRDQIVGRGFGAEKIHFIPCGIDFLLLHRDGKARDETRGRQGWQDKKVVLYFGAHGRANNLDIVLDAAHLLRGDEKVIFVLVGNGMEKARLVARAVEMELKNVCFLPSVAKNEAKNYINAADICVVTLQDIPLFYGAIPTKLLDYMACGKVVVGGFRGEAQSILAQAEAGMVFEPDNAQQLAEHIMYLLAHETVAVAMGEKGEHYVRQHFSSAMMLAKMAHLLEHTAKPKKGLNV